MSRAEGETTHLQLQLIRRFGLLLILIALFPVVVWAGDEDLLLAEIPTVYAASRHEQPVTEAPAAVTVITRDDIVKYAEPYRRRRCITSSSISASAGFIGKPIAVSPSPRISFIDEE